MARCLDSYVKLVENWNSVQHCPLGSQTKPQARRETPGSLGFDHRYSQ